MKSFRLLLLCICSVQALTTTAQIPQLIYTAPQPFTRAITSMNGNVFAMVADTTPYPYRYNPTLIDGLTGQTTRLAYNPKVYDPGFGVISNELVKAGNRLYWVMFDTPVVGGNGRQLWSSDGTAAGTQRITRKPEWGLPYISCDAISMEKNFATSDNQLGFRGTDYQSAGLCLTDGSPGNTRMIVQNYYLPAQPLNQGPHIVSIDGTTMFLYDSSTVTSLYTYDAVNGFKRKPGTVRISFGDSQFLGVRGNAAYFYGVHHRTSIDSAYVFKLTKEKLEIVFSYSCSTPSACMTKEAIYFKVDLANGWRPAIRRYDLLTKDISTVIADPGQLVQVFEAMGNLVAVGNRIYFTCMTPQEKIELWTSDGTPAGTAAMNALGPGTESGPRVDNGIPSDNLGTAHSPWCFQYCSRLFFTGWSPHAGAIAMYMVDSASNVSVRIIDSLSYNGNLSMAASHGRVFIQHGADIYRIDVCDPLATAVGDIKSAGNEISVYPNPATSTAQIDGLKSPLQSAVAVDMLGRQTPLRFTRATLDVSVLPPGYYGLLLQDASGTYRTRLMIR